MSYESWRISYQSSEQAARAAYAEVEALRKEVVEWKRVAAAQAELHGEAEARAERLEEALRRYRNEVPLGHQPQMLAHEVDDMLNHTAAQEGKESFWPKLPDSGEPDWTGFDG